MGKRKKRSGEKRKSKVSEAAANAVKKTRTQHIPVHTDGLEKFVEMSANSRYKRHASTGWRCLKCKHGFYGEWKERPNSQSKCPHCTSCRIQQQDCLYHCLNCDTEYREFPGGPLRAKFSDPSCPNKRCKEVTGKRHPGDVAERGKYVEWLNYEEWVKSHPLDWGKS